ncbi:MAG: hypothetical protein QOG87_3797 [Actinomycetota bacterium]
MTTVERRHEEVDSGHLAVLGHRLLGSAAVVTGALATLRDGNGSISTAQHDLLDGEVERNLASITAVARMLIQGAVLGEATREFCAQCYGRESVWIDGKTVPCTCLTWPRLVELGAEVRGGAAEPGQLDR